MWLENEALRDAAFGNMAEAKQAVTEGLKIVPATPIADIEVKVEAALASAMGRDSVRAKSLARDVNKRSLLATQVQVLWLPAVEAPLWSSIRKTQMRL